MWVDWCEEEEENMIKDQRTSGVLLGQKDRWGGVWGKREQREIKTHPSQGLISPDERE